MTLISRRQLFRSSGSVAAAPLNALRATPVAGTPAAPAPRNAPPRRAPLSRPPFDHALHAFARTIAAMAEGRLLPSGLRIAARNAKLVGHHLMATGFDQSFRAVASSIDPATLAPAPDLDAVLAFLRRSDGAIVPGGLPALTPERVTALGAEFHRAGLSQLYFDVATRFKVLARVPGAPLVTDVHVVRLPETAVVAIGLLQRMRALAKAGRSPFDAGLRERMGVRGDFSRRVAGDVGEAIVLATAAVAHLDAHVAEAELEWTTASAASEEVSQR